MKRVSISLLFILFGCAIGALGVLVAAYLPLPPESSLYRLLGIEKKYVMGYQPYWLMGKATQPYPMLTNVAYFGLALDTDGSVVQLANPGEEEPGWTTLKGKAFADMKTKASLSGQSLGLVLHMADEASISALLMEPKNHGETLVGSVAPIMKKFGFTQLHLDVESFATATPGAQQQFTTFLSTVAGGFHAQLLGQLIVEMPVRALYAPLMQDPVVVGSIADLVVIMAYDYSYSGSYIAGPVAPIGGVPETREMDVTSTIERALKVIPKQKIILGIPLYGYQWETLSDSNPAVIPGSGATASNRRIEELLQECTGCKRMLDTVSLESIVTSPSGEVVTQIHIEDGESLAKKVELVKKYDLGGVALWALGYEAMDMLSPLNPYKKGFHFIF